MHTGWRWYALQVEPGAEFATQRRLIAAGFHTFLPRLHLRKRSDARRLLANDSRMADLAGGYLSSQNLQIAVLALTLQRETLSQPCGALLPARSSSDHICTVPP